MNWLWLKGDGGRQRVRYESGQGQNRSSPSSRKNQGRRQASGRSGGDRDPRLHQRAMSHQLSKVLTTEVEKMIPSAARAM